MLTYGQKTSQDVSYMTSWDETVYFSQLLFDEVYLMCPYIVRENG